MRGPAPEIDPRRVAGWVVAFVVAGAAWIGLATAAMAVTS